MCKILIIMLLLSPASVFAYDSGQYGSVQYGGISENVITAEMSLDIQAALSNGNNTNTQELLSLLAQATDSIEGTRTFTKALILSAISQMEQSNALNAYAAHTLSATVSQIQTITLDRQAVANLIGYITQTQTGDIGQTLEVALSAIATMTLTNNSAFVSGLSLGAQVGLTNAAAVINATVVELSVQGQLSEAAILLAYGATILNTVASTGQVSNVDWYGMLNLSSQAYIESQAFLAGIAYDVYLSLATVAGIAIQSNVNLISDLTLTAQADMTILLGSVIKEGIVTLTAQGSLEEASRLTYLGSVLLSMMVRDTESSNQIFLNAPLILNAVANYVTGSTTQLENIVVRIRASMLTPNTGFLNKQPSTIFYMVK